MPRKPSRTADALTIIHRRHYVNRPDRELALEAERANAAIARKLYALRQAVGLSQRALAALVDTTASVICRLEDADYDGHSLAMLQRTARAVNKRVEIRVVSRGTTPPAARSGQRTAASQ